MKIIKDMDSYTEGYKDALNVKENFKYQILGYDLVEILKIVSNHYDRQKDKIMTYDEASNEIKRMGVTDPHSLLRVLMLFDLVKIETKPNIIPAFVTKNDDYLEIWCENNLLHTIKLY